MPALRINLRDEVITIVAASLPEYAGHITAAKLDKVEKGVAASIYSPAGENALGAMRGVRQRTQRVEVVLFGSADSDIEAKLSDQLNTLEKAVEAARLNGAFGDITFAFLEEFSIDQDATSKGKRGELHASFRFDFSESLA